MSRDALLMVSTSFPQSGDGSEAAGGFVADLAQTLRSHLPVRVVAPGAREELEEFPGGIEVYRFASPGRPLSLLSPARPSDWPSIVSTLRSMRRQTLNAARDGHVAHTLALWALPSGWAARELQRSSGVPYSVWALGSDIWSLGKILGVRMVLRGVIRGADHRYADGLQLAADAESLSGLPFEFLPSSRRLSRERKRAVVQTPPYRLLFLGRWHENKGVDILLDAIAMLPPDVWARVSEVRIAGGGPLERMVQSRCAALQAKGLPVRLDGFLDNASATDALESSDYLLLPSRIESIPVVFSDAMKMQLPVISMPVGDMPGLISGSGVGHLAAEVSAVAFAECIAAAVQQPPRESLPNIAAIAEKFSVERSADRLLADLRMTAAEPYGARRDD